MDFKTTIARRRFLACPFALHVFASVIFLLAIFDSVANSQDAPKSDFTTGDDQTEQELRNEIEPGVVVFGKSSKFSAAGNCSSFDVSPDGRTLVCAGRKLKIYDLKTHEVREEVGEEGDNAYQKVYYSPDGRYLLAYAYHGKMKSVLRVWDAISMNLENSFALQEGLEDEKGFENFYPQNLAISADNTYVALASYNAIVVREFDSGEIVSKHSNLNFVRQLNFSPDERHLYYPGSGKLNVINLETGESVHRSESKIAPATSQSIAVSLSRNLAATGNGTSIRIHDLEDGSDRTIQLPPKHLIQQTVFSDDGSKLATSVWITGSVGENQMGVVVTDIDSGETIKTINGLGQSLDGCVKFSVDGEKLLLAGSKLYGIVEVDLAAESTDESDLSKAFPISPSDSIVIHPSSQTFATSTASGAVNVFDIETGEILRELASSGANRILLSQDGKSLFSFGLLNRSSITRYDYDTGKKKRQYSLKPKSGGVVSALRSFMKAETGSTNNQSYSISFNVSDDGVELSGVTMEVTFRSGDLMSGQDFRQEHGIGFSKFDVESGTRVSAEKYSLEKFGLQRNEWVQQAAVAPGGSRFAFFRKNEICCVSSGDGEIIFENPIGTRAASVEFSPDGRFLVATNQKGKTFVWDADTGEEIANLESDGKRSMPAIVTFSPDSTRMVFCGRSQGKVQVLDTESWEPLFERDKTEFKRNSVAISEDGNRIVFGLSDCRLEVWDLTKLK